MPSVGPFHTRARCMPLLSGSRLLLSLPRLPVNFLHHLGILTGFPLDTCPPLAQLRTAFACWVASPSQEYAHRACSQILRNPQYNFLEPSNPRAIFFYICILSLPRTDKTSSSATINCCLPDSEQRPIVGFPHHASQAPHGQRYLGQSGPPFVAEPQARI